MLPLVTERLVVKAQVETMDRCLPQENFKHPSMKSIQEVAVCCNLLNSHSLTHACADNSTHLV